MSAFAQIEQRVRELVSAALEVLYAKNKKQDARLDAIEERLDALENPAPATAAKRQTVAGKAQTAKGSGGAS